MVVRVWSGLGRTDLTERGKGRVRRVGAKKGEIEKKSQLKIHLKQQYGLFPVFTISRAFILCGFVRCGEIFPSHFIVLLLPKSCRVSKFSVDACFVRFSSTDASSSFVYIQKRAMTAARSVFHARSCLLLPVCCQKERNIKAKKKRREKDVYVM